MTDKNNAFNPETTKELQNDWQGYGKMSVSYGLVVLFIFTVSAVYHLFIQ